MREKKLRERMGAAFVRLNICMCFIKQAEITLRAVMIMRHSRSTGQFGKPQRYTNTTQQPRSTSPPPSTPGGNNIHSSTIPPYFYHGSNVTTIVAIHVPHLSAHNADPAGSGGNIGGEECVRLHPSEAKERKGL